MCAMNGKGQLQQQDGQCAEGEWAFIVHLAESLSNCIPIYDFILI
jgi:hypothetical protein